MTLLELYQSQRTDGAKGETARALLAQTHWFTVNAEFDPKTGDPLPQVLSAFLSKVSNEKPQGILQDRLYRITEHARSAVERLFRSRNESPRREHALLPVHAVRELDAGSFIKLSTRPGRNIREKLAGKPYLQAVRRFQSIDLPENRLLKAYVARLAELLELRRDYLGEKEDELLPRIQSWLLSDEAKAIGRWDQLPPNNTLLSHRDYRHVWDSWRRLQTLDDDIERDLSGMDFRCDTMRCWINYGRKYREGTYLFAEMPVLFDYEKFTIRTWSPEPIVQRAVQRIGRSVVKRSISQSVCIDLAEMHPRYADTEKGSHVLNENYLWQQWHNDTQHVDIALFNSDAAYIHPDATSIALPDLFFTNDKSIEHLDRAARTFVAQLRETFRDDKVVWLVPDFLNDFELEIIRRNLNAHFPCAQPLPRSVAAVFEQMDYMRITNDGYPIVVVDTIGGTTYATKLLARFDQDIKKRLPETNGFYWERCPPVILPCLDAEQATEKERCYEMITVDGDGQWFDTIRPERPQSIEPRTLKSNPLIGQFAFCINVIQSPVVGGMRLHALQERAEGIPLWRDQIPALSIKVMKDGRYQRFYLVSRGTTVKPIRGLSVRVPVQESFRLRAGKTFYQFPLFQGENADELAFSARLDSPSFPLKQDTECNLNLTFEYGADEPYKLVFTPLDKSFPAIRATWRRTEEVIITDAPAPDYPEPISWTDLRSVPKQGSQETSDLLEWFISAIDRLDRDFFIRPRPRSVGTVITEWREDRNGNHFAFAECSEAGSDVFIHENSFVGDVDFSAFHEGQKVSFELQVGDDGRYKGEKIAGLTYRNNNAITDVVKGIRKSLYYPVIQLWRDGRSITDMKCPKDFQKAAEKRIAYLADLVDQAEIPQSIKNNLLFLLACLHKDTSDNCVQWIADQVKGGNIHDSRAIGFSLGDLSQGWQQSIFRRLASHSDSAAISVFAYAIWRERHFVEQFSLSEMKALLNALSQQLANIRPVKTGNDRTNARLTKKKWYWARATVEPLELLLGLLRTRASDDPAIRMLLQPHQKMTKFFAEQIDRIEDIIVETHVILSSRVQMNIPKPEGVRTPDLLYALRLYLAGDDGANAIHIASISDGDND
jgi:cold shock CspA family protein